MRATRLPTGVLPANRRDDALSLLRQAFPAVEPRDDVLDGALMNAGPIIHPPLIIMNAGPIEHFDKWDIHKEGTQPSIRRVTDVLDAERMAVREALGYGPPHYPLRDHYTSDRWMYGNLAHDKLVDSGDWKEKLEAEKGPLQKTLAKVNEEIGKLEPRVATANADPKAAEYFEAKWSLDQMKKQVEELKKADPVDQPKVDELGKKITEQEKKVGELKAGVP